MSDPRTPDAIINVSGEVHHRFELFASWQFRNADMVTQKQYDDDGVPTIRLRHNGVWMPPGQRQLMTLDDTMALVRKVVSSKLSGK